MNATGPNEFFGVLWVPEFRLQAALRQARFVARFEETAAVLTSGRPPRVLECNTRATAACVLPGMSLPEAMVRCPGLRWVERSEAAETGASVLLRETAFLLSPWVEETASGTCTWLCAGVARSSTRRLLEEKLLPHLTNLGIDSVAGLGPNPGMALLAAHAAHASSARAATGSEVSKSRIWRVESANAFADLPLAPLVEPGLRGLLDLWGLRRIGDLAALDRSAWVERLGAEAGKIWDLASGAVQRPLRCCHPPERFWETVDLEESRVETLEPLLFVLRQMLLSLMRRLENLWLAVAELELTLRLENGSVCSRRFALPAASCQPDLLFRVLHTHLEGVRTEEAITGITLELFPIRPARQQFDLLNQSFRDPNQFFETLSRLQTLLGPDRVGVPEMEASHRPDQFKLAPPTLTTGSASSNESGPGTLRRAALETVAYGLVLRRFRPPIPAQVRAEPDPVEIRSPPATGLVTARRGPWCGSGDWWTGRPWNRREWDVEIVGGQLCRICEENGAWLLEGIYD
jgi:protein ImuB